MSLSICALALILVGPHAAATALLTISGLGRLHADETRNKFAHPRRSGSGGNLQRPQMRFPLSYCAFVLLLVLGPVASSRAQGPGRSAPETYGLHAAAALSSVTLDLDDAGSRTMPALAVDLGYRLRIPCCRSRRPVSVTPLFGIQVTSIAGVNEGSDDVAFASITPGVQLAARIGAVRPFLTWRDGKRTMERFDRVDGADTLVATNYIGEGHSLAVGVEVPLARTRWGQGLTLSVARLRGRFTSIERAGEDSPTRLPFNATIVNVGWSGRFRGTSLLFQ